MQCIQGSFGRLQVPLEISHKERRGNLLETCVQLHNLQVRKVGINQIKNVYVKQWTELQEQEELWGHFENMLFKDQCANDWVQGFHTYISWE